MNPDQALVEPRTETSTEDRPAAPAADVALPSGDRPANPAAAADVLPDDEDRTGTKATSASVLPLEDRSANAATAGAPGGVDWKKRAASLSPKWISLIAAGFSLLSFVIALAGLHARLRGPASATPAAPVAAAAVAPSVPSSKAPGTPPPLLLAPPPETAASADAAAARLPLAASQQGEDYSVALRRLNDEANELMPNLLPLPIPEEQYQDLANRFQKMASKYFPELSVRGSRLNRDFVARYKQYRDQTPAFFDQPDWPIQLTVECVEALSKRQAAPAAGDELPADAPPSPLQRPPLDQ